MPRRRKTPKEGAESSAEAESSKQAASILRAEAPVFIAQPRPSAPAQTPQAGYAQPRASAPAQTPQAGYAPPVAQPRAYAAAVPAQTQIRPPQIRPSPDPQQATTSVAVIEKGITELKVVASFKPPEHALKFPPRPGYGKAGKPCNIKANHFLARLRSDRDIYQYDVTITPEIISRGMNRAIVNQLILLYKDRNLGGKLPAYDGRKSLYTSGPLPFENKEFEIDVQDEDKGKGKTARRFKVVIKMAGSTNMYQLTEYLQGRLADTPQDALQALDIALRELPTYRYSPVGRSFFSPDLDGRPALGQGLECWSGFFQSLRPTQMGLSLNVDMSATAFLRPLPLINFLEDLGYRDLKRGLLDRDYQKIKKVLKGVRIEVTHRGKARRKYRIVGLTSEATKDLKFLEKDTTEKYVTDYFRETYNHEISYPLLPCLCVGKDGKNFLPMEVCKIVEGQRYMKRLQQSQVDGIRRVTCKRPQEREQFILQTVKNNAYTRDKFACEFGIEVQENMALVNARVLDPPKLKFHDSGSIKEHVPLCGRWDMRNKKMVNGGRVLRWACLNFAADSGLAAEFCRGLINMCITSGMTFERNPLTEVFGGHLKDPINSLKALCRKAHSVARGQQLDILLVLLPDNNGSLYGDLKRTCETEIGIISQCCLLKNIRKCNPQYFANVALKINVKVGGRNTVLMDAALSRLPMVTDKPTILFGADVTHPHPGEDSSPSIAAVVGSQDWPEISKYACLVQSQGHRKEIIENLADMVKELLMLFKAATRTQPGRIIFYRDGVSEGQFQQVLWHEKEAIKKACKDLHEDYKPTLTFVVVQKRHHTRLFASNHRDRNLTDRSGNILPGTVVDTKICHPTEFDFYLCSHAGIQGTSRPAHYHVLYDENQFTADGLQTLTNSLCYTYARSTNSVSIVPPAYYAHLAAFRARFYMGEEDSDASTQTGGSDAPIRQLPKLKENLKTVMFYC